MIQFAASSAVVNVFEASNIIVTLTRTGGTSGDVRVNLETVSQTAEPGLQEVHDAFIPGADCGSRTHSGPTSTCPDQPPGDYVEPVYVDDTGFKRQNRISVVFLDGETQKTVQISTIDDALYEHTIESLQLKIIPGTLQIRQKGELLWRQSNAIGSILMSQIYIEDNFDQNPPG